MSLCRLKDVLRIAVGEEGATVHVVAEVASVLVLDVRPPWLLVVRRLGRALPRAVQQAARHQKSGKGSH